MNKVLSVSFLILTVLSIGLNLFLKTLINDSDHIDEEYASLEFDGQIESREYSFESFECLSFFYDRDSLTDFSKKTCYLGAVPHLKIVNSDEYRVEITTNADVFDRLKIGTSEDRLVITMADDCYVPVHVDDVSYDYDTGLYLTLDKFEVTVYAPIRSFSADGQLTLDYEAPKCERLSIDFSFEGVDGSIHGIDSESLVLYCSGTSNLSLSGEVGGTTRIMIFHNTKIDATELDMKKRDFFVSTQLFGGLSYIKSGVIYRLGIFDALNAIFAIIRLAPIIWLTAAIVVGRRRSF